MRAPLVLLAVLFCSQADAAAIGGGYDSDAQVYFDVLAANSCAAPTPAFKLAVSNYIKAERVAGNWGSQDMEYMLATTDSCTASINLAQPTLYKVTWSGSPTFAVQTGMSCNGSSMFGDTNVNQSALTRYTQNNGHSEVWATVVAGGSNLLGLAGSVGNRIAWNASNKLTNMNTGTIITDTGQTSGLQYGDRTSSSLVNTGVNGTATTTGGSAAAAALFAGDVLIGKTNASFCAAGSNILAVGVGAAMNDEASHYTNVRNLLLALGVTGI